MKKIILLTLLCSQCVLAAEYGVFMVVKGKVKIESASTVVEAKVSSKVKVGDTVITEKDSRAKIVMSDRNIINISPDTKLKIEKYTNSGSEKIVSLILIQGKIRNNVEQKYDNQNSKFEVRTATAVAGVRGTQFITSYNTITKVTEVITLKGQVSFQSITSGGGLPNGEVIMVGKGEKSQVNEGSVPAPPLKIPDKELKQIENESNVKGKEPNGIKPGERGRHGAPVEGGKGEGGNNDPSGAGSGNENPPPRPPNIGTPLIDMISGNTQIIDGSAARKFDKSKIRIITQPAN